MVQKKNKKKIKSNVSRNNNIAEKFQELADNLDSVHTRIGNQVRAGDFEAQVYSALGEEFQKEQDKIKIDSSQELLLKMTMQQLNIGVDGKHGDGDQSMLSGNDAQILRNQWSDGTRDYIHSIHAPWSTPSINK